MTPELRSKITAALEESQGHFQSAAKSLGVTRRTLYNHVYQDAELKVKWVTERHPPPDSSVQLHRPTIPGDGDSPLFTQSDQNDALALAKEDALMKDGLEAMKITGATKDLAVALQQFQRKHYARVIEMMGGGAAKQYLDLMVEIQLINKQLEDDELDPQKELMLREDRRGLLDMLVKLHDRVDKAAMTQAKIAYLKKAGSKGGKPDGKPKGFLAIQAQPGSNVHVHTKDEAEEDPEGE